MKRQGVPLPEVGEKSGKGAAALAGAPLPVLRAGVAVRASLPVLRDTAYPAEQSNWTPGINCPSIHRGGSGEGDCGLQAYHLIQHVLANVSKLSKGTWQQWAEQLADVGVASPEWGRTGLSSALLGLPLKTTRRQANVREAAAKRPCRQPPHMLQGSARASPELRTVDGKAALVPKALRPSLAGPALDPSAAAAQRVMPSSMANQLAGKRPAYGNAAADLRDPLGVALRAGSLCTMVITHALPRDTYSNLLGFIDAHFPGAVGELNHTHHFVTSFTQSLLRGLDNMQCQALSAVLPALRVPSDFFRTWDSLTPLCGEPLLMHMLGIVDTNTGFMQPLLLDMLPMTMDCPAKKAYGMDEECSLAQLGRSSEARTKRTAFWLSYHTPGKVADKIIHIERQYGLEDKDARARLS